MDSGWSENYDQYLDNFKEFADILEPTSTTDSSNISDIDLSSLSISENDLKPSGLPEEDNFCIKCKANNIIIEDGLKICKSCGECNEFIFDSGVEWRYYPGQDTKSSDPTRCGIPPNKLLEDLSYSTSISKGTKYSKTMYNIIKQHIYISNDKYKSRTLLKTFEDMYNKAIKLGIPLNVLEDAKIIYSNVRDIKISRGINKEAIIIISLFIACNIGGHFANIKEFSKSFNIKQSIMTNARKKLYIILKHLNDLNIINKIKVQNPLDFIPKYCSLLNLEPNYEKLIKLLVLKLMKLPDISENTPPAITAGTIYMISNLCNLNINKKNISIITDISEVTIIKCYKKILQWKGVLFSEKMINYYNIDISTLK